jgi:hypothetical protein
VDCRDQGGIRKDFKSFLEGFEVIDSDEYRCRLTMSGDDDAFMCRCNFFDDAG